MKICPFCKCEMNDEDRVCPSCHGDVDNTAVETGKMKKSPARILVAIGAVAVMLGIIVFSLRPLFVRNEDYYKLDHSIQYFTNADSNTVWVFDGEKAVTIEGELDYYSNKGLPFIINHEHGKVFAVSDEVLYLVTEDGAQVIDTGVFDIRASVDGETVSYIKTGEDYFNGDLYVWSDGEKRCIDTDVGSISYALSPNGKTVAYSKDVTESDDKCDTYVSKNGKAGKKIGENMLISGISDDAKTMIYMDSENELVISKGRKKTVLSENSGSELKVYFNRYFTELLYVCNDTLYLSKNAEEGELIRENVSEVFFRVPDGNMYSSVDMLGINLTGEWVSIGSFTDKLLSCFPSEGYDAKVFSFDDDLDVTEYSSDAVVYAFDDMDLIYLENETLYKAVFRKDSSEKAIVSGVQNAVVSDDMDKIYFINTAGELCRLDGDEGVVLDSGVTGLAMDGDENVYYIRNHNGETGELCMISKDGEIVPVEGGGAAMSFVNLGDKVGIIADPSGDDGVYTYGTLYRIEDSKCNIISENIAMFRSNPPIPRI